MMNTELIEADLDIEWYTAQAAADFLRVLLITRQSEEAALRSVDRDLESLTIWSVVGTWDISDPESAHQLVPSVIEDRLDMVIIDRPETLADRVYREEHRRIARDCIHYLQEKTGAAVVVAGGLEGR
ncbi:hypothetical protein [Bradyrhizobium elkanii]|uniref:hypothetical protein n=1 Tax=Bradyrhizobium elkanii TaxID=29448 RepID=UPI00351286D4